MVTVSVITYNYPIFVKDAPNIHWRKDSLFKKEETWISTWRNLKLDPYFSLSTKFNPKWIKNLNIKPDIRAEEMAQGLRVHTAIAESAWVLFWVPMSGNSTSCNTRSKVI